MVARGADLGSAMSRSILSWASQWRYQSASARDLRLDLLRGCFVVAMLVDHLGGRSWFYLVTGGNRFYVSAAEGFVALSGLVMGLVYAQLIRRHGLWAATQRALRRAATLYLLAVGLGVTFQLISNWLGATWAMPVTSPSQLVLAIMSLRTGIYLADVLMLYAGLVAAAPAALALMRRGLTGPLLGGSIGLWGAHQLGLTGLLDAHLSGLEWFPPLAWQLVFLIGLSLGYHWMALQRRIGRWRWGWHLLALAVAATMLIAMAQAGPSGPLADRVATFFMKEGLHPGRLLAAAIFLPLIFGLITVCWWPLRFALGWLLLPLGQRALWAYCLHLFAALVANVWWPSIPGYELEDIGRNTLAQAGALLAVWLVVRLGPRLITLTVQPMSLLLACTGRWRVVSLLPQPAALVGRLALAIGVVGLLSQSLPAVESGAGGAPWSAVGAQLQVAAVQPTMAERQPRPAAVTPIVRRAAPAAVTPITRRSVPALATTPAAAGVATVAPSVVGQPVDYPDRRSTPSSLAGSRVIHSMFYSPALDRNMDYLILLPAGYERSDERYPVLYLLHGLGGSHREWADNGLLERAGQRLSDGNLPPMLIVLPEGEDGYWLNHTAGGPRWGDYVVTDLVAYIDATYRTRPQRSQRAIGGLSMGGHAALTLALQHGDRFGVVGMHSPSFRSEVEMADIFGQGAEFAAHDPFQLLTRRVVGQSSLALWLDVGDADRWLEESTALHRQLADLQIEHRFQVFPGVHDTPYWAEHVDDYLTFYGTALHYPPGSTVTTNP